MKGGGDKLLRNDDGYFVDVSEQANIYSSLIGFGLGVTVGDINQDGWLDIYVSNDFYERDYLYINQQNGTFKEEIKGWMNHISSASMGADMADMNNDGLLDVFVTDMLPADDQRLKETTQFESFDIHHLKVNRDFHEQYMHNTFQLNNGGTGFSEIAAFSGIAATDWSWGALLFDMDSDGYKDVFVCNGIYHELTNQDFVSYIANEVVQKMALTGEKEAVNDVVNKMPVRPIKNQAFRNNKDLTFTNHSDAWGFDKKTFSNGAAYGDLDNDGDYDLVINNVNQPVMVYENFAVDRGANYIKLYLNDTLNNSNSIGSKIYAHIGDQVLFQELMPTKGFQSSVDYALSIGLGQHSAVDSIQIVWPNGKQQSLINPAINTSHRVYYSDANNKLDEKKIVQKTIFQQSSVHASAHRENAFIDYNHQPLLTEMYSREGPALATGDVNGDGREDIFLGNAKGQQAQLLIQNQEGGFDEKPTPVFLHHKYFEDVVSVFIDIDGDADLDLIVGSGGNQSIQAKAYRDRIYTNDGAGNFSYAPHALPNYRSNTSVIAPVDFDLDGDTDIFIGNRIVSSAFGVAPRSIFLENNGQGVFKNATGIKAHDARQLGMITDAKWVDLTGDDYLDLVVVGDWMAPRLFKNSQGKYLEEIRSNINDLNGWWNTLLSGDFNEDGFVDFVLGNKGQNSLYSATPEARAKVYINDFDNNGTLDPIHTREINGKDYPVHLRTELLQQLVSLKKENTSFNTYAAKSVDQLLEKGKLKNSNILEVNVSNTMLLMGGEEQQFQIGTLPQEVQWSSVNTGIVDDVNNDGFLDLILAGGDNYLKPQFGQIDAGYGELLLGDGEGNFQWIPNRISGLELKGMVRNSKKIVVKGRKAYWFGINNKKSQLYIKQ